MAQADVAETVRRAQQGEVAAYGELVERFRDAVFALCYHRCEDFEAARDLAQDTFLRAYQRLHQLSRPEHFAAWLRRIAERVCVDWRRKQPPEAPLDAGADQAGPSPHEAAALRLAIRDALSRLPEAQRLATTLFYINGYSYREIAAFLSAPETTVKARLDAARETLRGALADLVGGGLQAQRPPDTFQQEVMMRVTQVQMKEAVNQSSGGPELVLLLSDDQSAVAIIIGAAEATSIRTALDKWEPPRPMTYDLMLNALSAFGIRVTGVRIGDLRDNVYFAELQLSRGKSVKAIDCRASDAVNLALRADVPVEIDRVVIEKAGISPEQAWQDYGNLPDYPSK